MSIVTTGSDASSLLLSSPVLVSIAAIGAASIYYFWDRFFVLEDGNDGGQARRRAKDSARPLSSENVEAKRSLGLDKGAASLFPSLLLSIFVIKNQFSL